jgi:hypothetical protein
MPPFILFLLLNAHQAQRTPIVNVAFSKQF